MKVPKFNVPLPTHLLKRVSDWEERSVNLRRTLKFCEPVSGPPFPLPCCPLKLPASMGLASVCRSESSCLFKFQETWGQRDIASKQLKRLPCPRPTRVLSSKSHMLPLMCTSSDSWVAKRGATPGHCGVWFHPIPQFQETVFCIWGLGRGVDLSSDAFFK